MAMVDYDLVYPKHGCPCLAFVEVEMTLDELKTASNRYLNGKMTQDSYHSAILRFLETASVDEYTAFALWVVEQGGKEH
jgi:hypothetical protein